MLIQTIHGGYEKKVLSWGSTTAQQSTKAEVHTSNSTEQPVLPVWVTPQSANFAEKRSARGASTVTSMVRLVGCFFRQSFNDTDMLGRKVDILRYKTSVFESTLARDGASPRTGIGCLRYFAVMGKYQYRPCAVQCWCGLTNSYATALNLFAKAHGTKICRSECACRGMQMAAVGSMKLSLLAFLSRLLS